MQEMNDEKFCKNVRLDQDGWLQEYFTKKNNLP